METASDTYQRLDRFALWYLLFEFGYTGLIIVLVILATVANLISGNSVGYSTSQAILLLGIVAPYALAFLGNLTVAIWGLVLHLREGRSGYPGTGHLLNWIFVCTTFWLVLFLAALIINM